MLTVQGLELCSRSSCPRTPTKPHPRPSLPSGRGLAGSAGSVAHQRPKEVLVDADERANADARRGGHPSATGMHTGCMKCGGEEISARAGKKESRASTDRVTMTRRVRQSPPPRASCISICASPPGCKSTAVATRLTSVGRRSISGAKLLRVHA